MIAAERERLKARRAEMFDTLEGCDWCCGGGDAELEFIEARLLETGGSE